MNAAARSEPRGFIAIYRFAVEPGHEAAFRAAWRAVTRQALELGSLGSCLTRDDNGEFVAIALWPSQRARDKAFSQIPPSAQWPGTRRISETRLAVADDLWRSSPFG